LILSIVHALTIKLRSKVSWTQSHLAILARFLARSRFSTPLTSARNGGPKLRVVKGALRRSWLA